MGAGAVHERSVLEVDAALLTAVVDLVPAEWLEPAPGAEDDEAVRAAYVDFLGARLAAPQAWLPGSVAR